jgi:hypothetical protein
MCQAHPAQFDSQQPETVKPAEGFTGIGYLKMIFLFHPII